MRKYIFLTIYFTLCSCSDRNESIDETKKQVIQNGDFDSYLTLSNTFDKEDNYYEILPYVLKMQKQGVGCHDFYYTYMKIVSDNQFDDKNIINLEKPERDFLIHILLKGAKKDDPNCKEVLIKYYKNGYGVEKNLQKADSIYATFEYPDTFTNP